MPRFFCSHCQSDTCFHQADPKNSRPSTVPSHDSFSFDTLINALPTIAATGGRPATALVRPIPIRPFQQQPTPPATPATAISQTYCSPPPLLAQPVQPVAAMMSPSSLPPSPETMIPRPCRLYQCPAGLPSSPPTILHPIKRTRALSPQPNNTESKRRRYANPLNSMNCD